MEFYDYICGNNSFEIYKIDTENAQELSLIHI